MTTKQKVIACHGYVNARSTARMCRVKINRVYTIWAKNGLKVQPETKNLTESMKFDS